jgi:formylglycine-generating enzyme required for sulfatase activity/predicted phosphodiesterase
MAGISWLHLSDWHQGGTDWDRSVVLEKLLERVGNRGEIAPELAELDFFVFSGDLAFSGSKAEFEAGWSQLLEPLCRRTSVPPERLFVVPGNHDVERSRFRLLPTELAQTVKSRDGILPWLLDEEMRGRLLDPFRSYSDLLHKYLPHQSAWASHSVFETRGRKVGIAGLNSAFMCGRQDASSSRGDYGGLVVGEPQLRAALKPIADAEIRIAIMHHPFEWLAEFDRSDIRRELLSSAHFLLSGHVHQAEIRAERGTDGDCVALPAGASYDRRNSTNQNYVNSFNFVHLDLDAGSGTAWIQKWSERNKAWVPDDETSRGGAFSFDLPEKQRPTPAGKTPGRVPVAGVPRRRTEFRTIRGREYCVIPAGPVLMGTTPQRSVELAKAENGSFGNETPQHNVTLEAYLIGRYPVTNREYKEFADATGHRVPYRDDEWSYNMNWDQQTRTYLPDRSDHPVVLVSWYDAMAYCQWLGGRLPTEAEWEKAARGEDGREWPWGNTWQNERANAGRDGIRNTTPVNQYGERGQSPWGVRDMAGNAWEWCSSIPDPYPYDPDDGRETTVTVGQRVHRGGAWLHPPSMVRCAVRGSADPRDFGFNLGFRVVLPAVP